MSIITEYRLRCDFCGHRSPVVQYTSINEHGTPIAPTMVLPRGWVKVDGLPRKSRYPYILEIPPDAHYCCAEHQKLAEAKEQEKAS